MKAIILRLMPLTFLLVSACTTNLHELKETKPFGSHYTQILAKTYLYKASEESENMDYLVSEFLSEKGLRASGGETIFADSIANWDVPAAKIQELAEARQLLHQAYKSNLHTRYPKLMAEAQVNFDAWIANLYYKNYEGAAEARNNMISSLSKMALNVVDKKNTQDKK